VRPRKFLSLPRNRPLSEPITTRWRRLRRIGGRRLGAAKTPEAKPTRLRGFGRPVVADCAPAPATPFADTFAAAPELAEALITLFGAAGKHLLADAAKSHVTGAREAHRCGSSADHPRCSGNFPPGFRQRQPRLFLKRQNDVDCQARRPTGQRRIGSLRALSGSWNLALGGIDQSLQAGIWRNAIGQRVNSNRSIVEVARYGSK
jgi:hypothetical protein